VTNNSESISGLTDTEMLDMLFDPNNSDVDIDFDDDDDDIPEPNKEFENNEPNSDSESDAEDNEPLATFTRPRESQLSWRHKNE